MIAIFYTEKDAVDFSEKIHKFLTENRPGYNAERWSELNKSDKEEKFAVKIPDDFQKWPKKLTIDTTVKEQIIQYPITWGKTEQVLGE